MKAFVDHHANLFADDPEIDEENDDVTIEEQQEAFARNILLWVKPLLVNKPWRPQPSAPGTGEVTPQAAYINLRRAIVNLGFLELLQQLFQRVRDHPEDVPYNVTLPPTVLLDMFLLQKPSSGGTKTQAACFVTPICLSHDCARPPFIDSLADTCLPLQKHQTDSKGAPNSRERENILKHGINVCSLLFVFV